MSSRGIAPVIGVVAMLAVVTTLAGVVAAVVPGVVDDTEPAQATIDLEVSENGETWELTFYHRGGDSLDLEQLDVVLHINDVRLEEQPNIGELNPRGGFQPMPQGVFNPSTGDNWRTGSSGTIVTATDGPAIAPGDRIVAVWYQDGHPVAESRAIASG